MTRKGRVGGTKSFLFTAIALLALAVWAVKDGWFPSADMEKHQLFNQTLAVMSLLGSAVCAYIHYLVR